jgi:hypothetical protein
MMRWVAIAIGLLVLFLLLLYPHARAHDHGPGAWINHENLRDPMSREHCCDLRDCREETDNVEAVGGDFRIKSTGETIPHQRVIWRSPGGWWRCRYLDPARNGETRCLIGPPPGA